ncbi:MAG: 4-(cytidine 5'-diphospho)-2-C-methyl-D-erythritol kinase [Proteobacteria bacterium]|nr:4-(cytidine 5'-diphospho)-2-C-methyl-D-erythritol kinase [Pseudomonadota bacterium]
MKILSPAKINLFLHVSGKRPDGYHDIVSLICCVSLYDVMSFDFGGGITTVTCTDPEIPCDERNHALKAASLFLGKFRKNEGVRIHIEKNIPAGAGLGGGSSNAATVLSCLNKWFGNPFPVEEIMAMGLEIGADVPFFLYRKPALATGIGEKLKEYPLKLPYKILIVYPGFGVLTQEVYNNLNLRLTNCKNKLKKLIFVQEFHAKLLCNDLESVTVSKYPEINEAKEAILKQGAAGALMSGSGSSVFGLFPDNDSAINAGNVLSQNRRWRVFVVDAIC